jgi:hypothetical protein
VAHNNAGATTGPLWSFTTSASVAKPGVPTSPIPTTGATGVAITPTLSWSATGATSYDVSFGTTNPPPVVSSRQSGATYAPTALTRGTTYFWRVVARNAAGTTSGSVWSFTTTTTAEPVNVVIYASDIPASARHGSWSAATDPTSPNSTKLVTPDNGVAQTTSALAGPTDFVDVTFVAQAGVSYTLWMRLQAAANSKWNDSIWVQFSDARVAGSSVYVMNTANALLVNLATESTGSSLSGWGWVNGAYWLTQPSTVTFATSGTHSLRVQVREDGVGFDQIVLSPTTYLSLPPGPTANDSTIVLKP